MPPAAVLNPQTKRPVGKKRVYDVFRKLCYDEDPVKKLGEAVLYARFDRAALRWG